MCAFQPSETARVTHLGVPRRNGAARTVWQTPQQVRYQIGLAVLVQAAACGGNEGIALEAAPAAYAAVYCERAIACCETAELEAMLGSGVADSVSCEAFVTRVFGNEFIADTRRAVELERATYDDVAMAGCLEHMRTRECSDLARPLRFTTLSATCAPVRVALVPIGGECDHDFQCTSGACAGSGDHQVGRCEVVPAPGAPCPTGDCGRSAYCDRSGATAVCAPVNADGGTCTSSLGCESLQCSTGTCGPPVSCDGR